MGSDLKKCQLGESEEEIIERIFFALPFRNIDAAKIYEDLNNTLLENERLSSSSTRMPVIHLPKIAINFDIPKVNSYLENNVIRDDNICKKIHMEYFNNILLMDNNVLVLYTILLAICKGEKEEKVKYLSDVYERSNLLIDKDLFRIYLKEVIRANSSLCVKSFRELFGNKNTKRLEEVYSDFRRKKLCDYILSNYAVAFNDSYKDAEIPVNDSIVNDNKINQKFISKLFDLIFPSLKGEFIRSWLSEEYERDRPNFIGGECCNSTDD